MRILFFLCFYFCLLSAALGVLCGTRRCNPYDYAPTCAQRERAGKIETEIFPNDCVAEAANECGGGWAPCK